MRVFVTVGSTRFDPLIEASLSTAVLQALHSRGYTDITVQCGSSRGAGDLALPSEAGTASLMKDGVSVEAWRFKPSLQDEYERADLIISHAGSGTILDVLRMGKTLIVVPNPTLLDNHQAELAEALAARGHLYAAVISDLPRVIELMDGSKLVPFPQFDGSKFRALLDEEMGYI
ncbi:glycosyltransferase family 1 protein [Neolentinus lepideus HHB14362 ss-1]|uniref:UDP-N-acetylglucosamine transferase subunit ALG13 n=1 Tax=Neolentinus lepideus HHB14362 ss-1 TaxID=1314782 RepID=A0A165T7U8_9AGAM|nr:glycosyltransferase family 1 protein [Neolentinus lepideus HHB14362 ss-1]